jgi:hypothetical protein
LIFCFTKKAFHAAGPNGGAPLPWTECTSAINYNISGDSLVPLYAKFRQVEHIFHLLRCVVFLKKDVSLQQKPGFNVLVYSGDVDIATVPFFYTQPCLGELNARNTIP